MLLIRLMIFTSVDFKGPVSVVQSDSVETLPQGGVGKSSRIRFSPNLPVSTSTILRLRVRLMNVFPTKGLVSLSDAMSYSGESRLRLRIETVPLPSKGLLN